MSLKDRLKINTEEEKNISVNVPLKAKNMNNELFKEILDTDCNILVFCGINTPSHSAINYLCSMIESNKRLVGIGSNLLLNPDEIIKFEPEKKDNSKELIKTAMSLNPYKIILQDFDGVEAVDIFKLVNAGIKNIITSVGAKSPISALTQVELNLYMNGVQIPQDLMRTLIGEFIDKIICVEKVNNDLKIKNIYTLDGYENNLYKITECTETKQKNVNKKSVSKNEPVKVDVINEPVKKNILASKLKKKKINTK